MGAERVDAVHADAPLVAHLMLDAEVELLRLRILHRVVDDVDPRRALARQDEAGERIGDARRKRRQGGPSMSHEEHVTGAAPRSAARGRRGRARATESERDAVEVDAVAAVDAALAVGGRPVEADARPEVVQVPAAFAFQERLHDRIDLVVAGDVLDVGVQLVPQPEVDREVRAHAPVVLDEERRVRVVGVGNLQVLIRLAAAERHRKQQVVVVHLAVAVGVEGREVLRPAPRARPGTRPARSPHPRAAPRHRREARASRASS